MNHFFSAFRGFFRFRFLLSHPYQVQSFNYWKEITFVMQKFFSSKLLFKKAINRDYLHLHIIVVSKINLMGFYATRPRSNI